jgi:hypothetical protein
MGYMAAVLIFCGVVSSGAPVSVEEILETEGVFRFTDHSSVYSFLSDGSFLMEPVGISGRAVEGSWTTGDYGVFLITGRWTWYNGVSMDNDFREMELLITPLSAEADTVNGMAVYEVYFTVEELGPLLEL